MLQKNIKNPNEVTLHSDMLQSGVFHNQEKSTDPQKCNQVTADKKIVVIEIT